MNSWDAGLPSQATWEMRQRADWISGRVEAARRGLAEASASSRPFWANVLRDRVEALRAIEAEICEERRNRTGTPDGLEGAAGVMPLRGRPDSFGDP